MNMPNTIARKAKTRRGLIRSLGTAGLAGALGAEAVAAAEADMVFSLLPADNATGNFTKIVQRLTVRVRVPADVAGRNELRPGMSVIVNVNTKPGVAAKFAVDRKPTVKNAAIGPQPLPPQPVTTAAR